MSNRVAFGYTTVTETETHRECLLSKRMDVIEILMWIEFIISITVHCICF